MNFKKIIFGAVILVILYIFYTTVFADKSNSSLVEMHSALENLHIPYKKLYGSGSTDYTYSFWIYINDYNKNYGDKKMILERKEKLGDTNYYFPQIYLGENQNDIHFRISQSHSTAEATGGSATVKTFTQSDCTKAGMEFVPKTGDAAKCAISNHEIVVHNIPLQKWNHVIMTKSGSTIDIYIDGKLVKTSIMDTTAHKPNPETDINLTDKIDETTGFSGYLSKVVYNSGAVNTREAYQIYKEGNGSGGIGSFFNRFKLKFAFMQDNQEKSSIII
jgi:hypothetical protein